VTASEALRDKSLELIPGASQTFSKAPRTFVQGVAPVFLQRGRGGRVWDLDGHEYIDYILGLGSVFLGYHDRQFEEAVFAQITDGVNFGLPHPLECEVAERLVAHIPCAEMVRFGKNGSDATSGAVRLARFVTGREVILCCGYHGWQDWYIGTTSLAGGVPESVRRLTVSFPYNDLAALAALFDRHAGQVAAVIMEPMGTVWPDEGYLDGVRGLCSRHGAVLIFDEVLSGFRFGLAGAQGHFGVTPDLACLGKAMGNGFPISCIVGRRDLMKEYNQVFFSFTAGGEAASLAAARHVMDRLAVPGTIEAMWDTGRDLMDGVTRLAEEAGLAEVVECHGYPARHVIGLSHPDVAQPVLRTFWQQETVSRGVFNNAYHNLCLAHTGQDVRFTLEIYAQVMAALKQGLDAGDLPQRLAGPPLEPLFRPV
jgi:glutamate-1-semialdehyde aminotransferase